MYPMPACMFIRQEKALNNQRCQGEDIKRG